MFRSASCVISLSLFVCGVAIAQAACAAGVSGSYSFFSPVPMVIQQADSGMRLGIGRTHQHYVEVVPGKGTLDAEHGGLTSFTLGFGGQYDHLGSNVVIHYVTGNDRYDGGLQYYDPSTGHMASTPMSSTTKNRMIDLRYDLGLGFSPAPHLAVIPLIFGGFHFWNRVIEGVGGTTENYIDLYYGGGLKLQYAIDSFVLGVTGRYGTTSLAKMRNSLATFNLGSGPWYSAGVRLTYVPMSWLKVYAADTYTGFSYGASNSVNVGGGFSESEPHSRTQQNMIEVGVILF